MQDFELKIEYVALDEIKPYERNAREHGDEDVAAIMASIQEFGFNDPIGVWNGTIVEGHGRLLAAEKLGLSEVPIIRLDHMTDEQRRAYALAHNKTAELSRWDFDLMDDELASLSVFDMSEFGFEPYNLKGNTEKEKDSGKNELVCRCPRCGASVKK